MKLHSFRSPALAALLAFAAGSVARADEGMWLYSAPPRDQIKKKYGFDLTDAWLDHLAQVPLFAECDKRQLQQVAAAAVEISIDAGKVLVREGEPGHECFVIVTGSATVSRDGATLANLGPGAVVGELAPLTGGVRTATVTANSAMEVLVIAQREFNGLIEEVPGFAVQLLRNLAARMTDES